MFKRKANRLCIWVAGFGPIPLATEKDDQPEFVTGPPKRIGDDCLLFVEGQYRKARLLKAIGGTPFLIDMGPSVAFGG